MERTFEEMIAEAKEGIWPGGRKLTFVEKCGAFAALYAGMPNKIVARAFGISPQATSAISGCLESDPDPYRYEYQPGQNPDLEMPVRVMQDHNRNRSPVRKRRYEDVAREFEALGKEEFNRRYYTERVHKRIIIAKEELRAKRKRNDDPNAMTPYD